MKSLLKLIFNALVLLSPLVCEITRAENGSKKPKDVAQYDSFLASGLEQLYASSNKTKKNDKQIFASPHNLESIRKNNFRVTALAGKSVTLTCAIELNDVDFSKSGNYKVYLKRFFFNEKIAIFLAGV